MNTNARSMPGRDVTDARHRLRARTAAVHARLDAQFPDGLTGPAVYAAYVVGMHRFASDYEAMAGHLPRASMWLAQDLQHLQLTPLAPSGVCSPLACATERLGWEYVMAGSSLGARLLGRQALALGYTGDAGACFLTRHAIGDEWGRVLARLAALPATDEARFESLVRGAADAFALAYHCIERGLAAAPLDNAQEPAA